MLINSYFGGPMNLSLQYLTATRSLRAKGWSDTEIDAICEQIDFDANLHFFENFEQIASIQNAYNE